MQREELLSELGGLDGVLELAPGKDLRDIQLSALEGFVVSRIGAGIKLRELLQLTVLGEQDTLELLVRLLRGGVLRRPLGRRPDSTQNGSDLRRKRTRSGRIILEPLWKSGSTNAPATQQRSGRPHVVRSPESSSRSRPAASSTHRSSASNSAAGQRGTNVPARSSGSASSRPRRPSHPAPLPVSSRSAQKPRVGGSDPPKSKNPSGVVRLQDRSGVYRVLRSAPAVESPPPTSNSPGEPRTPTRRVAASGGRVAVLPVADGVRASAERFRADTPPPATLQQMAAQTIPWGPDAIDPEVEIEPELQRLLLYVHERLDEFDYYQILAVPRNADQRQIRKAFLRRTALFHPDRYFRRKLGGFSSRLHELYKALSMAYDALSDPKTRRIYDQTLSLSEQLAEGPGSPRHRHAATLYSEGKRLSESGDFAGAERALRQACDLEPKNDRYRVLLHRVQSMARREETRGSYERAVSFVREGHYGEAAVFLRELVRVRSDADTWHLLATSLRNANQYLHEAAEAARRATSMMPTSVEYALTLSEIEEKLGHGRAALAALDPVRGQAKDHPELDQRISRLAARRN